MMGPLITPLLLVGVVLYVAWPILREQQQSREPADHFNALLEQKEEAIEALRDLEMDFHMGKLSREDYESLRRKYEDEAVRLLKRLDDGETR